jgi:molybdopterin molybdotransferase
MREFLSLVTPENALSALNRNLRTGVGTEIIDARASLARIVAGNVPAPESLPSFPRSTMDGYAVRASDTYGASEGLPVYLRVVAEMPMGGSHNVDIGKGEAVKVHTGGAIVSGADAVVMVENTQSVDAAMIEVSRAAAPGENVLRVGDDIASGDLLFHSGHVIRPQDIGAMMALGLTQVSVYARPKVAIVSAGDEIVPPQVTPVSGQVRDINTYTIAGLVRQAGGVPLPQGIVGDDFDAMAQAGARAFADGDIVVFSSGSSISTRDMTARAISSLGRPGVLVHGVSIRPGKPTILAAIDGKPVFGLPGNPVSAMVVFDLFVRPTIYLVGGCPVAPRSPTVMARLTHNIASTTGREDYVPVTLEFKEGEYRASPVFGESNLIMTMVRADGVAMIPLDKHGLTQGELVNVRLF